MTLSSTGGTTVGEQVGQAQSAGKQKLIGPWRLVSCVGHWSDGRVSNPYGSNPGGLLIYDADDNFSAHIQARGRPAFESGNLLRGTTEEIKSAFEGYVAYYGTYEVDELAGRLTHHVEGSLFPNWVGVDQTRLFEISDNRLRLTTPPIVGKRSQLTLTLTWERSE